MVDVFSKIDINKINIMNGKFYFLATILGLSAMTASAQTQLTSVTKTLNNVTTTEAEYKYIGQAKPMVTDAGTYIFDHSYVPRSLFADSVFYRNDNNQLSFRLVNRFSNNKVAERDSYKETGAYDGITFFDYHPSGALKSEFYISDDSTYRSKYEYNDDGNLSYDYNLIENYDDSLNLIYKTEYYYIYDNNRLETRYRTVEYGPGASPGSGHGLDSIQYYYSNANSVNFDSAYTYMRTVTPSNNASWVLSEKNYRIYNTNGQMVKDSTLAGLWINNPEYRIKNYENFTDSTVVYEYKYRPNTPNNVTGGLERIIIHKTVPEGKLNGYIFFEGNINAFDYGYVDLLDQNNYYLVDNKVVRDTNGVFTYVPKVTINRHANNNINYIDVVESDSVQYRVNYNYADSSTSVEVLTTMELSIYPNPSNGIFTIEAKDIKQYNVQVYNAAGQLVAIFGNNPTTVDLSNKPSGNYIFKIQDKVSNQSAIKRVIKQ